MMSKLPKGYKQGVPRVSNIVSFKFPFEWTDWERRYLSWLKKVWVDENLYLQKAQTIWTYIHKCMEDYVNGEVVILAEYNEVVSKTIQLGFKYIDELRSEFWKEYNFVAEPVLMDKEERYQGSSDLVLVHKTKKKVIIIDWKSFGISKSFFLVKGTKKPLPNKYKKPYDKIKKGRLQFSLYWETYKQKWYEVEDLILVYLHEDWAYPYSLEQIKTEELNTILKEFSVNSKQWNSKHLFNNNFMYEIEILEPTKTYGNVKIKAEINPLNDDEKEVVENLIKKAKYVANKMKD